MKNLAGGDLATNTRGVLTVAAELPAAGFWDGADPSTVHAGFEWALADSLAKELGLRLAVRNEPFGDITTGRLGDADLALAEVSVTAARQGRVDFSVAYFSSAPAVLTTSAGKNIADLATAKGRRWAVEAGTTQEQYLTDVIAPDRPAIVASTETIAVQAVIDGSAEAALLDLPSALAEAHQRPSLLVPARFDRDERLAPVLPKGSANTAAVDRAMRALTANGTVQRLETRWLRPQLAADPASIPVIRARR